MHQYNLIRLGLCFPYLQLQLRLPQPCAVPVQEHPSTDLGPRAGDIVASVEDLVFAAASAMVFLGPQAPPMPPSSAAVPELDDPLDPSSAGGGGWGTEEAVVATAAGGAGGGARKDSEHHHGEHFNVGLPSSPLTSPVAVLGSAEDGFVAAGAAEGGQDSGHGQLGGAAEFRRGNSSSPPTDMLLSSGSPTSRSPVGGGRGGGGPSVFGEVLLFYREAACTSVLVPSILSIRFDLLGWFV